MIETATMALEDEPSIAPLGIPQGPGTPMLCRHERHSPIVFPEGLPPLEFHNVLKPQFSGKAAATPGQNTHFRRGKPTKGGFVKMIKVRVREQD